MDGIAFFSDCLRDFTVPYRSVDDGICASHNQPAALFDVNREHLCRGCILLRQAYAGPKGKSRLGLGSYMLLTPTDVMYWGNHYMPPPIKRQSATGSLRTIVRNLILTPPQPPWLFVAFARSNSPERMRVTTGNDLIYFSGKFLFPGTMDEPPVDRLNRKRVMDIWSVAPLDRNEWEKCARAHAALTYSTDALGYLQEVYQRYPGLANLPVPPIRTAEYNALRLLGTVS